MSNKKNPEAMSDKRTDGFTLIEIIITLVVLSIAAIGVLSVFATGMSGSANPLIVNKALQFAQGEMDAVIGQRAAGDFISITTGNPLACVTATPGFNCSRNIYYVTSGALNTSAGGPTNYKHITISVSSSTTGSISLDTIIANY